MQVNLKHLEILKLSKTPLLSQQTTNQVIEVITTHI